MFQKSGYILRHLISIITALIFVFPFISNCLAVDAAATLKVAFYELDGFFEYNEQGNETGYGVEFLNEITQYTGIQFEYLHADEWEETKEMVLSGVADIRMPATMPTKPSSELGYTAESVMDTYYTILTLKNRNDLYYNDFDKIGKLKIAITQGSLDKTSVTDYLPDLNISEDNLLVYEDYNACLEALRNGEVDALISNVMDLTDELKMLTRFNSVSNYISMSLENKYLDIISDAIYKINMEEPSFAFELYKKYYPERTSVPLTKEETQYIESLGEITFGFNDENGCLSDYEDEKYIGVYPAIVSAVCNKLDVDFNSISESELSENSDKPKVIADFYYDYALADEMNVDITSSFFTSNYYQIQKKNFGTNDENCIVAAVKDCYYTTDYILSHYSEENILWCDTFEECISAVNKSKADLTVINTYIAEYYLSEYRFNNLNSMLIEYSNKVCFAVKNDDTGLLASALSKTISSLSQDELNAMLLENTSRKPEQNFLDVILYRNPMYFAAAFIMFAIIIAIIIALIIINKNNRQKNTLLLEAVEKAKYAGETQSRFLSNISHDMRTPLNSIIGFTAIAVKSDNMEEKNECLNKIKISGNYMLGLINDTLNLSRLEAGKVKLVPEIIHSEVLAKNIMSTIISSADEKKIEVICDNTKSVKTVIKTDILRTQEIFLNILSNAVKFTPEGGTVYVSIETLEDNPMEIYDKISIRDTGIGMTESFLNEVFDPFTQENPQENGNFTGTGLGLSIVKGLIEQMGGKIDIKSEIGKGTEVIVFLTFEKAGTTEILEYNSDVEKISLEGKKVLLCEDHPLNVELAKRLLQKQGITIIVAENGKKGVEIFNASAEGEFDAVLMDIRMPVMDGLEATREIRKLKRRDAKIIPVIAMSANAFEEDREKSIDAGIDAYLAKPINPNELYKTLYEQSEKFRSIMK